MRILLLSLLLFGCSNTYTIRTTPTNVPVKVDGEYIGHSPATHKSYCTTFGSKPIVEVGKIKQPLAYEVDWINVAADAILFWPMLLVNVECPKDLYQFDLNLE